MDWVRPEGSSSRWFSAEDLSEPISMDRQSTWQTLMGRIRRIGNACVEVCSTLGRFLWNLVPMTVFRRSLTWVRSLFTSRQQRHLNGPTPHSNPVLDDEMPMADPASMPEAASRAEAAPMSDEECPQLDRNSSHQKKGKQE